MSNYQPSHDIDRFDFTKDLAFGHEGEEIVNTFLSSLSAGSFEVKYDRYRNGRMVVETHQNPRGQGWKPSGINVTTAHWWVYLFSPGAFISVSVGRLKKYLVMNKDNLTKKEFAPNSDNPTRGFLLFPPNITDLMTNEDYDTAKEA